jgi:cytoskeletal protein RodZ
VILLGVVVLVLGIALFVAPMLGFVWVTGGEGIVIAVVLVIAGLALVLVGARRARTTETQAAAPTGAPSSAGGWVPPPSTPASPTGTSAPASPTDAASAAAGQAPVSGSTVAAPTAAPASPTGERAPESPTAASRPASEAPPPPRDE